MSTADFYDAMAPFYHLVYPDWQASIETQGAQLTEIIRGRWHADMADILDATCGVGTQALGLAMRGFSVSASDLSAKCVDRLKGEAAARSLNINASVCDIRQLFDCHQRQFDLVLSCDNSLPHLKADELPMAIEQMFRCTRVGGGCLITLRDYAKENLQGQQFRPYGVRKVNGIKYIAFQTWDCSEASYQVSLYFVEDDGQASPSCHAMRGTYYPITIDRLMSLLADAGFSRIERLDGVFFQPVVIADRHG